MQEQSRLQQLAKATVRKNRLRRVIALLSCFVLLLTLNQLKFTVDALQRIPACNLCEHVHTESCYQDGELFCGLPEHEHTDACYQQRPVQPEPTVFDEFAEINSQVVLASPMEEEVDVDISAESVDEAVGETTLDLDTDGSAAGVYAEAGSDDNGVEVEYDLDDLYDENGDETVIADEKFENDAVDAGNDADETVAEYSLNGESVAFLSDILRAVGLEAAGITDVGEIVDNAFVAEHIAIEPVEGVDDEYVLKVIESFDRITLGVATADAIETVELTAGVAILSSDEVAASADIADEQTVDEQAAGEPVVEETVGQEDNIINSNAIIETEQKQTEVGEIETEVGWTDEASGIGEMTEVAPAENDESITDVTGTFNAQDAAQDADDVAAVEGGKTGDAQDDDTAAVEDDQTGDAQNDDTAAVEDHTGDTQDDDTAAVEDNHTGDEQDDDTAAVEDNQTDDEQTGEATVVKTVSLDFTDYKFDDTHTVYLYDADMRAVLVNTAEIGSVDGVVVTTVEEDVSSEEETEADTEEDSPAGVLIIEGDGEYALNDTVYAVTGMVFPEATGEEVQGEEQSDESNTTVDDQMDEAAQMDEVTTVEDQSANDTQDEAAPVKKTVSLDFTDFVATADHTVYLYDASMVAVLVNEAEIASTDGVTITLLEEEATETGEDHAAEDHATEEPGKGPVAEEPAVLIITGDGEYTLNGTTYVVTNLVLPVSVIEGTGADVDVDSDKEITISTSDGEATLPDAVPVFKETEENYDEIFNLFAVAQDEPSLLARVADVLFATAYAEEIETRTLQMKLFDIGLKDTDGSSLEPGTEVHIETTFAGIEGEDFRLYHIVDGRAELIPDAVVVEDGQAVGLNFNTVSLDKFALVYYTVNVVVEESNITVSVDFTDVVENGVDFDSQDILTALDDGVAIDVASLLAGDKESTLSVNVEGDNNAEVSSLDIAALEAVSAEGSVEYAEGAIKVTGDGAITLTDGTYTLIIVVTNYTGLTKKVLGDGVEISVLDGDVPMGASATYTDLSEAADTLAEQYGLAPTAGDEAAETVEDEAEDKAEEKDGAEAADGQTIEQDDAKGEPLVGFSAFDVSIATPSGELDADGTFAVTVEHTAEIPAGADCELFHIHSVDGEMVAEKVEDAAFGNGTVSFITNGFSEYVIRYTVDFEYVDDQGEIHTWSLPGRGAYSIADILNAVGIAGTVESVSLVRTDDQGGGANVLYLNDAHTELISEAAFRDTFELTVVVDGRKHSFTVTDDASPAYDSDTFSDYYDLEKHATSPTGSITLSVEGESTTNIDGTQTTQTVRLNLGFEMTDQEWLRAIRAKAIADNTTINIEYDLTDLINEHDTLKAIEANGADLMSPSGEIMGSFTIENGHVKMNINPNKIDANVSTMKGNIPIKVVIDGSTVTHPGNEDYVFPGASDTLKINWPGTGHPAGSKSVDHNYDIIYPAEPGNEYIYYDYTLTVKGGVGTDDLKLTDYLPSGMELYGSMSISRITTTRQQQSTRTNGLWGEWTDISSSSASATATAVPAANGAQVDVMGAFSPKAPDTATTPVVDGDTRTRSITESIYTITYKGRILKSEARTQIANKDNQPIRLTNHAMWNVGDNPFDGGSTTVTIAAGKMNPGTKVIEGVNTDTIQVPTVELLEINGKKYYKLTYIVSINEPIDATSAVLTDVLSGYQQLYNADQARLLVNDVEKGTVSLTASGADQNGKGGTITFDLTNALAHLSPAQTFTRNTRYSLKYETLVEYDVDFNKAITNTTDWHINDVYVDGEDRTVTVVPKPYQPVNKYDKLTTNHVVGDGPWEIPWELYTRQHQDAKEVTVTDTFSSDQTVDAGSFVIWVGNDQHNVPANAAYLHIDQGNHTFTIDFDDALKALVPGAADPSFKANTDYKINYTTNTSRFDNPETTNTEKSDNTSVWTFDGTPMDYSDDVVLVKDTYSTGYKLVSTMEGSGGGRWTTDGETWVESIKITDNKIDLSYKITLNQIVDGVSKAELTDTYSDQETVDFNTMKIAVDGTEYSVPGDLIQQNGKTFKVDFVRVMRRALNDPTYNLIKNKDYVLTYDTSITLTDEIKAALKAKENGNIVGLTVPNQQSWSFDGPNGPAETPGNSTEYTFKEKPYNGGDKTVAVFDTQSGAGMTQTEWINDGSMEVVLVDRVDNTLKYEISLTEHRNADLVVLHDTYTGGQTLNASSITVSFPHGGSTVTIPIDTSNGLTLGDHGFDINLTQVLSSQGYAFTPEVTYVIRYETTAVAGNISGDDGYNNTATWTIDGEDHEGGSTETHLKPADYVPGTKEVTVREQVGSATVNGTDWKDGSFSPSYDDSQRVHSHVVAEGPYHLDYTIKITEARSVDTALLTDRFYGSADQTLDTGSFTVLLPGQSTPTAIPASYITEVDRGFTLRFTDFLESLGRTFEKNKQYEIRFTTTTNRVNNILGNGDGADNKADWTLNGVSVDGGHTETHIKKVPFIDKEYYNVTDLDDESQAVKNGSVAFGDLVKHVITVGGPDDDMRSFYLEDNMMNLQHIDTNRGIIVTDANGEKIADLTQTATGSWNWGLIAQTAWDKNKTKIFYVVFPNSSDYPNPLNGPIHITYYAHAASESDFISACGRATTDVTNTVRSNEAEVTVQYPLTPGGAALEKTALPIDPSKLLHDNVTVSWQVVVTPSGAGTSLKGIWVADEPMRFCTTSLQDAINGVGTHDMTLVQDSVRVKYQNAGDGHAAGDPVPASMWEATPRTIWVGDGVPQVYAIKFKEDIFEPVIVTFDTNGRGWGWYNVGENVYFYNRAVLIDGSNYQHISEPDDATNQYETNGEILATKEFLADRVNKETGEICWKITVNTTGSVTFQDLYVIEKTATYRMEDNVVKEIATYEWDASKYSDITVKDRNGNVLVKGEDYVICQIATEAYREGIKFLHGNIQGPVDIEVPMTVNGRNWGHDPGFANGKTTMHNIAIVGNGPETRRDVTADGEVENYNLTVDKSFHSASTPITGPDFNQEVTYEIRINAEKSYLPEGKPILVDVLPAGMEYVQGSLGLQAWGTHASYASGWVQVNNNASSAWTDFSVNGRNLSLSFPEGFSFTGTELYMTYRARLTAAEIQRLKNLGVNTVQVYDNVVTVTQSNIEAHDNVTWEYQWDKGVHKEDVTDAHYKDLGFDQAPYVYYKITINPEERRLNGGVELVLTDRIETSMELVLSSVEVKDRNGVPVTGAKISYDGITRVLTVRVPDQTYCEVLFYTSIENPTLNEPRTFTNTAVLTGETVFTSSETVEHTVVNMSGIIEYTVNKGFIIRKVDGNNINQTLPGAEFTLYKAKFPAMDRVDYESDYEAHPESYDLADYVLQGKDPSFTPVVKTTGSDGTVFFENLDMNTLYYWVETKTPGDDYSAGLFAEPQYLILYNKNDEASYNEAKMLDHLITDANGVIVNSAVQSFVWVATNNKQVNYKVTKLWSDGDNVENLRPSKVWVQLRQNGADYGEPVGIEANNLGRWEYTWFDLPATDDNGEDYIYTAVELTPEEALEAGKITEQEAAALTEQMANYTTLYREVTGGMEITNRLRDETTLIIHKDWNDQNNINYLRPGSVQVYLWRVTDDDTTTKVCVGPKSASDNTIEEKFVDTPIILTAKDGWQAEFTGLVKVDGDHTYTYYLTEDPVDGYKTSYDITYEDGGMANTDYIIRFTNDLDEVRATKTWADGVDTSKIESITYAISRSIDGHEDVEFNALDTSTVRIAKTAGSASANLTEVLYSENNNSWGYTWQNLNASGSVSYTPEGESEVVTVDGDYQYAVEEKGFVYDGKTFKVEFSDGGYTVKEVNTATSQETISHEWHVSREGNAFTNTPKVTITGTKNWHTAYAHTAYPTLKLMRYTTDDTTPVTVGCSNEDSTVYDPNGVNYLQPVWTGSGNTLTYTYSDLPKYNAQGQEYIYTVQEVRFTVVDEMNTPDDPADDVTYTYTVTYKEGTYTATGAVVNQTPTDGNSGTNANTGTDGNGPANGESSSVVPDFVVTSDGYDITNDEYVDIPVSKIWRKQTGGDTLTWPEDTSVTLELIRKSKDSTDASDETVYDSNNAPMQVTLTSEHQTDRFVHLPLYNGNGAEYTYSLKEVSVTTGNTSFDNPEAVFDHATNSSSCEEGINYINKLVSLKIIKVVAGTSTPLNGAKFQLTRRLLGEQSYSVFENSAFEEEPTTENGTPVTKRTGPFEVASNGEKEIDGLMPGDYKLQEVHAPVGYIIMTGEIEFTLDSNGKVTVNNNTPEEGKDCQLSSLVTFTQKIEAVAGNEETNTPASPAVPAKVTVQNEEGAALPSTGGHGTGMFYIIGSIITLLAALLLITNKRSDAAGIE